MIEIVNPGWLSFSVDRGRRGFSHIGVPSSSALDRYAFDAVNYLTGCSPGAPALEVIGKGFSFLAGLDVDCAITGAKARIFVDNSPVSPWTCFPVHRGSVLTVKDVEEGFRYYVGFSATMAFTRVMGSCATNLECGFGGFHGRPLLKGDIIEFEEMRHFEERSAAPLTIPVMDPPHLLRMVEGPEIDYFTEDSLKGFFGGGDSAGFIVSDRLNRTGVKLTGEPLVFVSDGAKSIISEGILPGTVQITGDGLPMIMLHERTIGGYARVGMVARVDRDLLAHLKPKDRVALKLVSIEEAERLWQEKREMLRLKGFPKDLFYGGHTVLDFGKAALS
jgi:antagonist of KipI